MISNTINNKNTMPDTDCLIPIYNVILIKKKKKLSLYIVVYITTPN